MRTSVSSELAEDEVVITFSVIKSAVQFLAVSFSLIGNCILVYLVITKSSKKMGNYRHLMCYFSVYSIVYAILDCMVQPYIYRHGVSFSIIMDLRDSALSADVAFFFVAEYFFSEGHEY